MAGAEGARARAAIAMGAMAEATAIGSGASVDCGTTGDTTACDNGAVAIEVNAVGTDGGSEGRIQKKIKRS